LAQGILREGKADFISMGRALIADPMFIRKVQQGRYREIRPCIGCTDCVNPYYRGKIPHMTCAVNPVAGEETKFKIEPALKPKNVLVVGGGPAGMEAAYVAVSRGHKATLWDKSDRLGGKLNIAALLPYQDELRDLVRYYEDELRRVGVVVELGKEATPISIIRQGADVVILATGSTASLPKGRGIARQKVAMAEDVLMGRAKVGGRVAVLGGGILGCELAEFLADRGSKVVIVKGSRELAFDASTVVRLHLLQSLERRGVEVIASAKDQEITHGGLTFGTLQGEKVTVAADTIVVAAGAAPDTRLFESLRGRIPELYSVGDCANPGKIWEAIRDGAGVGARI